MVMLKNVKVGFSKFNEGSRFEPNSDLRYTGSVILEEGDENYKAVRKAIMSELKNCGVRKDRAERIFESKVKEEEKHAENQVEVDPELCRFFWAGSTTKPLITRKQDGRVIQSKDKDDVDTYGESVFQVWGGDTINLLIKVKYFPKFSKLAVWPQHIHIVTDSDKKEGVTEYFDEMTGGDPKDLKNSDGGDEDDDDWDEAPKKSKPVRKKGGSKKTPEVDEDDGDDWDETPKKSKPVRKKRGFKKTPEVDEGDEDDDWDETPKKSKPVRKKRGSSKTPKVDNTVNEEETGEDFKWED